MLMIVNPVGKFKKTTPYPLCHDKTNSHLTPTKNLEKPPKRLAYNVYKSSEFYNWVVPIYVGVVRVRDPKMALSAASRRWGSGFYRAYKIKLP